MRLILTVFIVLSWLSCTGEKDKNPGTKDSVVVIKLREVSKERATPSKLPVASFKEKVHDPRIGGEFIVELYETPETFQYKMMITFGKMKAKDTVKLPDFGVLPIPVIKKGKETTSCIVGFLDEKSHFMEYKLVQGTREKVKVKTLQRYAVATYRVN